MFVQSNATYGVSSMALSSQIFTLSDVESWVFLVIVAGVRRHNAFSETSCFIFKKG
jgi:hypothetical protein